MRTIVGLIPIFFCTYTFSSVMNEKIRENWAFDTICAAIYKMQCVPRPLNSYVHVFVPNESTFSIRLEVPRKT